MPPPDHDGPDHVSLNVDDARRVDQACERFESAWQELGFELDGPPIEDFVGETEGPVRVALLRELVRIDIHYRRQRGELPPTEQYRGRFPDLDRTWLDEAMGATRDGASNELDATHDSPSDGRPQDQTAEYVPSTADDQPIDGTSEPNPGPITARASMRRPSLPAVPRYEILGELGRGAMGVVYRARQVGLDRPVALKMILSGAHASDAELERFRQEGLALARLKHPNVVQIYDVGEHEGRPYFALEYLDGGTLARKLGGKPLAARPAAEMALALARGVAAAHDLKIIHRDLKPANVLLDAEGRPKITDFGLAKRLEDDSGQTRTGAVMGTPSYMAPEQAWGQIDRIGPATDVYALGAILYELVTARPPFQGATTIEVLDQVRHKEPVDPAELAPKLPRDLDTIILKALQKDPARRYPTAGAMADDIERFLQGRPILARPVSAVERTWRFVRRYPLESSLTAAVVALLVTVAIVSTVFSYRLDKRSREAEIARDQARDALSAAVIARDGEEVAHKEAMNQNSFALDAIRSIIVNIDNRLRGDPATRALRKPFVDLALRELEKVKDGAIKTTMADRDTARILQRLGEIYRLAGQTREAAATYATAAEALERYAKANPDEAVSVRNLAAIANTRAELLVQLGDLRTARELYARALVLRKKWATLLPDHPDTLEAIARSHGYLGKVAILAGDPAGARDEYSEAIAGFDALPAEKAAQLATRQLRTEQQRGLSVALMRLDDPDRAEEALQALLKQCLASLKEVGRTPSLLRDLAEAHSLLGEFHRCVRHDLARAWAEFAAAEPIYRALTKLDKDAIPPRRDLAKLLYRLGETAKALEQAATPAGPDDRRAPSATYLDECLLLRQAIAEADPDDIQARFEWMLALARSGKTDQARTIAEELVKKADGDVRLLFQAACGLALCGVGEARDRAFAVLDSLVAAGWKDRFALEADPDLDPIRDDTRFAALLDRVPKPAG